MPRTVKEWIGRTADTPVPPRVRLRVLDRFHWRCDECKRRICPGDKWTCDHRVAIILGGENCEFNLRPLCEWCTPIKDASDQNEKSRTYRIRARHAGIRMKPKGRPLPGTVASGIKLRINAPPVWRDSGKVVGGK